MASGVCDIASPSCSRRPGKPVYIVEGEKDVEALRALGVEATCTPGGAMKWHKVAECAREAPAGRHVVIVPDKDEGSRACNPGRPRRDGLRGERAALRAAGRQRQGRGGTGVKVTASRFSSSDPNRIRKREAPRGAP
jgi:hypothetical protein